MDSDKERMETLESEQQSYIVFTMAVVAMGMSPKGTKRVIDRALIESGSNISSSVGLLLLYAVRVAIWRDIEPKKDGSQKLFKDLETSVSSVETILHYFHLTVKNIP